MNHCNWTDWPGGPRPIALDQWALVRFRSGGVSLIEGRELAMRHDWDHIDSPGDIVAYTPLGVCAGGIWFPAEAP